jgi:hypothetical protein
VLADAGFERLGGLPGVVMRAARAVSLEWRGAKSARTYIFEFK